MISLGIKNYPSYIGDYFIIQEQGIPMNQPGFNGMIEGWLKNIAQLSQLDVIYIYILYFTGYIRVYVFFKYI